MLITQKVIFIAEIKDREVEAMDRIVEFAICVGSRLRLLNFRKKGKTLLRRPDVPLQPRTS